MRWHVSDTSEQEAFLGETGPEGGQAWEAGLGLVLTEDHRKMLRPPSRMCISGCGPPSWGPCYFIMSFWKHTVDTAPILPDPGSQSVGSWLFRS